VRHCARPRKCIVRFSERPYITSGLCVLFVLSTSSPLPLLRSFDVSKTPLHLHKRRSTATPDFQHGLRSQEALGCTRIEPIQQEGQVHSGPEPRQSVWSGLLLLMDGLLHRLLVLVSIGSYLFDPAAAYIIQVRVSASCKAAIPPVYSMCNRA
jgi:hypothetical protein